MNQTTSAYQYPRSGIGLGSTRTQTGPDLNWLVKPPENKLRLRSITVTKRGPALAGSSGRLLMPSRPLARSSSLCAKQGVHGTVGLVAAIKGVKPKDQLEAMLAAQIATIHFSTMMLARQFSEAESLIHQDNAERTLNKFARTFTNQLEALKRYRTGGEQKVTVQHVQAMVGHVTQAARGFPAEMPANATAALTDEGQSAMPIMDKPERSSVPVRRRRNNDGGSSA